MATGWIIAAIVVFLGACCWLYWYGYQSPGAIEHLRHYQDYPLGYSDDPNGDASYLRVLLFPVLGLFYLIAGAGLTALRLMRGTLWQDRPPPSSDAPQLARRLYGSRL